MRRVALALATGLAAIAAAVGVTLAKAPASVIAINFSQRQLLGSAGSPLSGCQADETLPRGTTAIRLALEAFTGPQVTLAAYAGGRVIARGEHGSGWTGNVVTLPIAPQRVAHARATICFAFSVYDETVDVRGEPTAPALAARNGSGAPLPGRVRVEYLRPGRSWWSLAPSVARRMGLGHALGGAWDVVLALALMAALVVCASRLALRELR
jgi:hypothetical protein